MTVYPAAVTPFDARGNVDPAGVAKLIAWFRAAECDGVVVAGTNGEGPSLSAVEKRDLTRLAVDLSEGLRVVLGIASDSLAEAVWLSKQAGRSGAEAVLVMPPRFFPEAGQDGLARWYEALCSDGDSPVIVYNFPRRTGVRFELETIARLAANERVVGFKDSSGEVDNLAAYRSVSNGRRLLVGDETLLLKALENGWTGTISGAANVIPNWLVQTVRDYSQQAESATAKFDLVLVAIRALRSTPQPAGNKEILRRLGVLPSASVRLPLIAPESKDLDQVAEVVRRFVR